MNGHWAYKYREQVGGQVIRELSLLKFRVLLSALRTTTTRLILLHLKFACFLEVLVGNIISMHRTGSSKYLQLPAHDSSDIGKPSPLALLAATCQKIGAGSPSHSPKHRPRTPTPVLLSHVSRPEQPIGQPSPPVVPAPIRSPVSPVERESTRLQSKSPAYELPLTPPSSPPQVVESKTSSPRITSVPVPVSIPNERVSYAAEQPCHLPLQPVLHMPGLHHHYSPYTMVVPAPSPIIAPYTGCVNQCYHAPQLPAVHPMLLPAASLLPAAPISPPLSFGTYLHHHDVFEARMSSAGKMRSHLAAKSAGHPLYRPYDFTKHPRRSMADDEIIDVVSV